MNIDENILEYGKRFLISYLKDKKINYETVHPWRRNWEFVILHSLRVEGYVRKILNGENHNLTEDEVLLTRLAAILHDIGRIDKREEHAVLGKKIVQDWLIRDKSILEHIKDSDRLLYLIERHSDKEGKEGDYCLEVLRDADVLDEIGVLSIFMASNWIEKENPYFFNILSDRIEGFEIRFCDKGFKLLNTETAKRILAEKREFITLFNEQLKDELYGTETLGQTSIEDYYNWRG